MHTALTGPSEALKPYVPRLVIDWLRTTPDARHRIVGGSLAFVDISGFTQLTEKLARKGKVGAEAVSDTLDAVFTQLLDVAYGYGAGLLKWGGDALLLFFSGHDHARRCCRAAVGMQATLDRVGRLRTSGGAVTLRMSVGVHSGSFDFFLVGASHRELVITGPAATATVDMEADAAAGEILISPATAAQLDPGDLGEAKGAGVLLRGAPETPPERAPDVGDVSALDLPSCIPTELRKHLLVEHGEAEHRTVSVAFLQFSGTDALLAERGPDTASGALEALVGRSQKACDRYGVTFFATDINRDGGKIIMVSGAPWSGGDDEERLLRAVRAIMDDPGEIPVRIGVNTGRAFTCDFGPPYRRSYQIYGDAVNLAARVMGKCEPGEALVTDSTLSRARTTYELRPLEPFMLKGKSEPVTASVLGAATGTRSTAHGGTPLVGREHEMGVLLGAAASARAGQGRVIELIGEPGIGKSRLVEEVARQAPDLASFWAFSEQYESSTPYFAFREVLQAALGIAHHADSTAAEAALRERVRTDVPGLEPWLPLLGTPLGLDLPATHETSLLEDKFIPHRTAEIVHELLASVRAEPTLFVFDDVHWLDEASAGLLAHLAARAGDLPWLLLVTRRDVDTGFVATDGPHVERLRPAPLTAAAAAKLANAATSNAPLPPHVLRAVTERSGGNPLLLGELIAAALGGASVDDLPSSVEALMTAQIDRLEPKARTVLRYAAVLGGSFETDLLLDALREEIPAPGDDLWAHLADFIREDAPGTFRFHHALARDAAYEGLPFRRRRALHERVGVTIERRAGDRAGEDAEILSLHFFHARDFPRAWRYSRVAGDRARSIYANAEASDLYARALDSARRLGGLRAAEVAEVAEALGDVLERLGLFRRAASAFRDARRRRAGDAIAESALMLKEGWIPEREGRYPQALRWFRRGLRRLEASEGTAAGAIRAQLMAGYATVRQMQGRSAEAVRRCREAIAEAELAGERRALAHAYHIMDWAYVELGQPQAAVFSPLALAIYKELNDLANQAVVLNMMAMIAYYQGRWNQAVDLNEEAARLLAALGDPVRRADAVFNIAEIRCDQLRLAEALTLLDEALRVWRAARWRARVALGTRLQGVIALRAGRPAEAMPLFEQAREGFAELGAQNDVTASDGRIIECLLAEGRAENALALARDAVARATAAGARNVHLPMLRRVQGAALLQAGDVEGARAALEESLQAARAQKAGYEVALTLGELVRLAKIEGGVAPSGLEAERDAILAGLGVVLPPQPAAQPNPRVSSEP